MRIVLINPAWTKVFGVFSKIGYQASSFPPLGLCYLASLARQNGHDVKLIDAEIERMDMSQIVKEAVSFSPDVIGMTATTPVFHIAKELAGELKKITNAPILIGGRHVSYYKEKILDENFDFVFIGEGEKSFIQFLDCLERKKDLASVKGIAFKIAGKDLFTGDPEQFTNLDELPFPARDLLPMDKYVTNTVYHGRLNYTTIFMSRGCPFQCVYCAAPKLSGTSVRWFSLSHVMKEIEDVMHNSNVRHFYFFDDTLTLDRKYILDFCKEIDRRKLRFTWEGCTRTNLIDEDLIAAMAGAGLIRISFGLESADPEVRKIIKKEIPLETVEKAHKITARYNVETIDSSMLGLPGETQEKVWKTVNFIRNARSIQHSTFSIAMPYPGTEFYDMAKKGEHGLRLHTEDFSKYQRYDSAVLTVNDMEPSDIIMLQKLGLLKIYIAPFRIKQIIRRFDLWTMLAPFLAAIAALARYACVVFTKFFHRDKNRT